MASVKALGGALAERVQEAVTLASQSTPAGDPRWDAFLTGLGLAPPTATERLAVQLQGMPNLKGALPIELRSALGVLRRQFERELRQLAASLESTEDLLEIAALERELSSLVDREIQQYLEHCRPKATVSSIFANARRTTASMGAAVKNTFKALRCRVCGAARPEGTELHVCAYCGSDFFPEEKP